jgi:hypothetical protein
VPISDQRENREIEIAVEEIIERWSGERKECEEGTTVGRIIGVE